MRILIISIPRSGSTSLMFKLSTEYNLIPVFEPFRKHLTNEKFNSTFQYNMQNVVVKTMVYQHTNNVDLSKIFDKTILLSRRDLKSCAESLAYLTKNGKYGYSLDEDYFYENISDEEFQINYQAIEKYNQQIKNLSNELELPIIYYEDIFDINSPKRLRKFHKEETKYII